jgi:Tfp pilus assembly protein FimT
MKLLKSIRGPEPLGAFALIELIIVILILGVLAVVAFANMVNMPTMRIDMAARKIQSDIRYAQSLAVSTQRWVGLVFSTTNDNYSIYIDSVDDGTSNPSGWSLATNPLTNQAFTVQLNSDEFQNVDITIVYFNAANRYLIFDKWGNPYSYNGTGAPVALANPAGVRLAISSDTTDVRVERGTGRVYIQ